MEPRRLRVIDTDAAEPSYTAACDEAILLARSRELVPDTLHLYRRSRPVISLGYFQNAESCVYISLAKENGVAMLRRLSGGSAIYTDPGQIIYSITLSADDVPEAPMGSYPILCQGIVLALERLGIPAVWKPLNDVVVEGRKISGSAQTRQHGAVLQHIGEHGPGPHGLVVEALGGKDDPEQDGHDHGERSLRKASGPG
jgi:lipoate-protein ligase A